MTTTNKEWLERLYGNSPGYFAMTIVPKGQLFKNARHVWFGTEELDKATKNIEATADKGDIYLSVGTHTEPQAKRGGEETILSIPGFWADLDIGELGHQPATLPNPATEDQALQIVADLPQPSMLMHSGGGLQGFWLFEDGPWVLSDPAEKIKAKKAVQGFGNLLEQQGHLLGYHVDKVSDLARIMRAPGSVNHKRGMSRPVAVRWADKPAADIKVEEVASPVPITKAIGTDWDDIVKPHGYTKIDDLSYWRPGKTEGSLSLSIDPEDGGETITNFSGSDPLLKAGMKYTRETLWEALNPKPQFQSTKKLKLNAASSIPMKRVRWIWEDRIAVGTLALLAGREGLGKSTLAYTLAAQVTRGTLPGEFMGQPRGVIVVATEDSWSHTIVPRLAAAGADLNRVYQVASTDPDEYGVSLPRDIDELSEASRDTNTGLILLDPLVSRLGDLDTHKDSETRKALEPLVKMADDSRAAVLGLIHANKSGSTDPLTTIMGSKAFTAVARAVIYIAEDAENRDIKVVGQPKNNLGRSNLPELTYTLETATVGEDDGPIITGRLVWGEERENGELRKIMATNPRTVITKVDSAKDWLEVYLTHRGRSLRSQIIKEGMAAGHAEHNLKKARASLGVIVEQVGMPAVSWWYIDGTDVITG